MGLVCPGMYSIDLDAWRTAVGHKNAAILSAWQYPWIFPS